STGEPPPSTFNYAWDIADKISGDGTARGAGGKADPCSPDLMIAGEHQACTAPADQCFALARGPFWCMRIIA
ncbi:hypothetical protein, partial [Burkholderia cenocepacia]|uniref:hypothetical protein n=1 Tax=Burkholderia cenocepacia TaxID=95486 RepID=UPI001C2E20B0